MRCVNDDIVVFFCVVWRW